MQSIRKSSILGTIFFALFFPMFRINPDEDEPVVKELTIDQIINGGSGFPGLVPFMERFLQDTATEIETSCQIKVFLSFFPDFEPLLDIY